MIFQVSGWRKCTSKYKTTAEVELNFLLEFFSLAEAKILSKTAINKQPRIFSSSQAGARRGEVAKVIFFLLHFFAVFLNRRFCCSSHRKTHFSRVGGEFAFKKRKGPRRKKEKSQRKEATKEWIYIQFKNENRWRNSPEQRSSEKPVFISQARFVRLIIALFCCRRALEIARPHSFLSPVLAWKLGRDVK